MKTNRRSGWDGGDQGGGGDHRVEGLEAAEVAGVEDVEPRFEAGGGAGVGAGFTPGEGRLVAPVVDDGEPVLGDAPAGERAVEAGGLDGEVGGSAVGEAAEPFHRAPDPGLSHAGLEDGIGPEILDVEDVGHAAEAAVEGGDGAECDEVVDVDDVGAPAEPEGGSGGGGEARVVEHAPKRGGVVAGEEGDAEDGNVVEAFVLAEADTVAGVESAAGVVGEPGENPGVVAAAAEFAGEGNRLEGGFGVAPLGIEEDPHAVAGHFCQTTRFT